MSDISLLLKEQNDLARRVIWFAAALGLKRGVGPFPFLMGTALKPGRCGLSEARYLKALEGLDQAAEVLG